MNNSYQDLLDTIETISILDAPVTLLPLELTTQLLLRWLQSGKFHLVVTSNPEMLLESLRDEELFYIIRTSDLVTADGAGLLWAAAFQRKEERRPLGSPHLARDLSTESADPAHSRRSVLFLSKAFIKSVLSIFRALFLLGALTVAPKRYCGIVPERVTGIDLMTSLLTSLPSGTRIYFAGSHDSTLRVLSRRMEQQYPHLIFKTSLGLPTDYEALSKNNFNNPSQALLTSDIATFRPVVLFTAFGVPKQEKWLFHSHKNFASVRVGIGVGGAFEMFAGLQRRAPRILQRLHVEWLWRLLREPSRLPRIFRATVVFVSVMILSDMRLIYRRFRKNVVAVVFRTHPTNSTPEVLICERADQQGHWQFPQGGIERGESPEQAAIRELREEVGLAQVEIIGRSAHSHQYQWTEPHFLGYIGQTQTVCYGVVAGDSPLVLNHDFTRHQWVALDSLVHILHEFRKPVGEIAIRDWREGIINQMSSRA